MVNLHSVAFGEFLPGCLGLLCFLLSPPRNQSQTINRRELSFFQPLECQKNSQISHIQRFGGGGWVGSHDLVFCLLQLQMLKYHTPFLIFILAAIVLCNLSTPSHEKHGCLEPVTDCFDSGAQAATGALCCCLFMFLKPPCERCCGNHDRNKHPINLIVYQLSGEAERQQSPTQQRCPCSSLSCLEKHGELQEKKKSLELYGD